MSPLVVAWMTMSVVLCPLGGVEADLLVADPATGRLMELQGEFPSCSLHTDRHMIRSKLLRADPRRVHPSSSEQFDALARACHENDASNHAGHRQTGFNYPGTKWCGPGNTASNFNDLGYHEAEDECCRSHDMCPKVLESGECAEGICNNALYTISHCDCDARFRRCLHNIGSETANLIGYIFFNVAQVTCFKEKKPCFPEDRQEQFGRCRNRFHVMARYEERGASSTGRGFEDVVSNLLGSFFHFRR